MADLAELNGMVKRMQGDGWEGKALIGLTGRHTLSGPWPAKPRLTARGRPRQLINRLLDYFYSHSQHCIPPLSSLREKQDWNLSDDVITEPQSSLIDLTDLNWFTGLIRLNFDWIIDLFGWYLIFSNVMQAIPGSLEYKGVFKTEGMLTLGLAFSLVL